MRGRRCTGGDGGVQQRHDPYDVRRCPPQGHGVRGQGDVGGGCDVRPDPALLLDRVRRRGRDAAGRPLRPRRPTARPLRHRRVLRGGGRARPGRRHPRTPLRRRGHHGDRPAAPAVPLRPPLRERRTLDRRPLPRRRPWRSSPRPRTPPPTPWAAWVPGPPCSWSRPARPASPSPHCCSGDGMCEGEGALPGTGRSVGDAAAVAACRIFSYATTTPHPANLPRPAKRPSGAEGLTVVRAVRPRQDSNLRPSA
ncbi:hypothetical protein ABID94_006714 [Streptomyces sp. PvR018]